MAVASTCGAGDWRGRGARRLRRNGTFHHMRTGDHPSMRDDDHDKKEDRPVAVVVDAMRS